MRNSDSNTTKFRFAQSKDELRFCTLPGGSHFRNLGAQLGLLRRALLARMGDFTVYKKALIEWVPSTVVITMSLNDEAAQSGMRGRVSHDWGHPTASGFCADDQVLLAKCSSQSPFRWLYYSARAWSHREAAEWLGSTVKQRHVASEVGLGHHWQSPNTRLLPVLVVTEMLSNRLDFELSAADLDTAATKFSGPCVMVLEQGVFCWPLSEIIRDCQQQGSLSIFQAQKRGSVVKFKLRGQPGSFGAKTLPSQWRLDGDAIESKLLRIFLDSWNQGTANISSRDLHLLLYKRVPVPDDNVPAVVQAEDRTTGVELGQRAPEVGIDVEMRGAPEVGIDVAMTDAPALDDSAVPNVGDDDDDDEVDDFHLALRMDDAMDFDAGTGARKKKAQHRARWTEYHWPDELPIDPATGETVWPCPCAEEEGCLVTFSSRDIAARHAREVHGPPQYPCKHCPAVFSRLQHLKSHMSSAHPEVQDTGFLGKREVLESSRWTDEQVKCLLSAMEKYPPQAHGRWKRIHADHGPAGKVDKVLYDKTVNQCAEKFRNLGKKGDITAPGRPRKWTETEVECLRRAMKRHGPEVPCRWNRIYEDHGPNGKLDQILAAKDVAKIRGKGDILKKADLGVQSEDWNVSTKGKKRALPDEDSPDDEPPPLGPSTTTTTRSKRGPKKRKL